MTRDEFKRRFNATGTIGNGSDLVPVPRVEPIKSYHVFCDLDEQKPEDNEVAIRYDGRDANMIALRLEADGISGACVITKPIFKQFPPEWSN